MNFDASEPAGELIALCDRLIDGSLGESDRIRLEEMVIGDPALRKLYVEYLQLHSHLTHHHALADSGPLRSVALPFPAKQTRTFTSGFLKIAAAVALASGVAAASWTLANRRHEIAVLRDVEGARWGNSTLPTEPGSSLGAGRLRLAEGLATLHFKSGAEVTLEGPAELELIDGMRCRLHRGSVVAHVPPPAKGFTVVTNQATLIDHGTDFGISTDAAGNASVHVMKGEVELRHKNGGEPVRLLSHQMTSITAENLDPAVSIELEPGNPGQREPSDAFTHEITTATGRGAATYVTSPNTPHHFSDTLLLLKNSRSETFLRKAVLRFDLDSPPLPATVNEARLTLHFDATGFGFASLGGDAKFAVYALTDDTADQWPADQLEWNDAPAFDPDPGRVDETKAVKVGEFTMPRGILRGPFSIEGPALVESLRTDANRLLTLIVVRVNALEQASGVVHGFAGNRHPNLPPPTIRLR